METQTQIQSRN